MLQQHNGRLLAALSLVLVVQIGCGVLPGPAGAQGPAGKDGTVTPPAQYFGYVVSQQSSTLMVLDTSINRIIRKVTHPDMVKPAWGRFHPSKKRFYAGGTGKVTIWDTTDVANPVYRKTVIPAVDSLGEYRGFAIYKGSTTAVDGSVWIANIQDGKVYVYQAADLEGAAPAPVKVFDTPTDGVRFPHVIQVRPGSNEVWLTNRPPNVNGFIMRFNGDTRTVITVPATKLETTSTVQDEPNEFAFSADGLLAYLGHHGPTQLNVAIINAASFTVKKLIPLIATAKAPGFVDVDLDGGRAYFVAKWGPMLAVVDTKSERVLRYIELGGFGVGYGVESTPDKKYLYISLGAPEQSAVIVIDAKTLTVVTNILDTDLNGPRSVRFTSN